MEAQSFGRYNSNDGPKPGEPIFLFVSRIPEADREKAIAEAFQKAKTQATKLAKAAGVELGGLKSLSSRSNSGGGNEYGYNSQAYRMMQMAQRMQMTGDDEDEENSAEALGAEAGPVKFNVVVTASFELGKGK
jgi:uncharacterized protein YggE